MGSKRRQETAPRSRRKRSQGEEPLPTSSDLAPTADPQANSPQTVLPDSSADAARTATEGTSSPASRANSLDALIEAERVELMQVFGILRCLYDVLLYSDDDDATLHADVAKVCGRLIDECVRRLEVIVKRYKAGEFRQSPETLTTNAEAECSPTILDRINEAAEGE